MKYKDVICFGYSLLFFILLLLSIPFMDSLMHKSGISFKNSNIYGCDFAPALIEWWFRFWWQLHSVMHMIFSLFLASNKIWIRFWTSLDLDCIISSSSTFFFFSKWTKMRKQLFYKQHQKHCLHTFAWIWYAIYWK